MIDFVKRIPVRGWRLVAYAAIVIAFAITAGALAREIHRVDKLATALHAGLVESCQVNGSPLRDAEREDLREGITNPNDPLIKVLFPNVPKAVADKIVHEGNKKKRERIRSIKPVDCFKQYGLHNNDP